MYDDGTYYSSKNCDFYDLTATQSAHSYGSGSTVTGEACVPMLYGGVAYQACTDETYR